MTQLIYHLSYFAGGQNQLIVGPFQAGQGSGGLLMPVSSGAQQQATSSGAASLSSTSLSTSVVPTSAIHSVMTTQVNKAYGKNGNYHSNGHLRF